MYLCIALGGGRITIVVWVSNKFPSFRWNGIQSIQNVIDVRYLTKPVQWFCVTFFILFFFQKTEHHHNVRNNWSAAWLFAEKCDFGVLKLKGDL